MNSLIEQLVQENDKNNLDPIMLQIAEIAKTPEDLLLVATRLSKHVRLFAESTNYLEVLSLLVDLFACCDFGNSGKHFIANLAYAITASEVVLFELAASNPKLVADLEFVQQIWAKFVVQDYSSLYVKEFLEKYKHLVPEDYQKLRSTELLLVESGVVCLTRASREYYKQNDLAYTDTIFYNPKTQDQLNVIGTIDALVRTLELTRNILAKKQDTS